MKIEVIRIVAWGCNHHMMLVKFSDETEQWLPITEHEYTLLKKQGVITSQKWRYIKDENKRLKK